MIRLAVDVREVKSRQPKDMTDEELATADELLQETIRHAEESGNIFLAAVLIGRRSAIGWEAKRRIKEQMDARGIL